MYFVTTNSVKTINISTGAVINSNFITGLNGGPVAPCVAGSYLYVSNYSSNTIGKYNLSDGSVVNASWISITQPFAMCTDGTYLYVSSPGQNSVK